MRSAILILVAAFSVPAHARTWPTSIGEGSISRWSGDRISAFTVTIDDNHAQDHEFWRELGEEYGLKWTWCVITENVGSGNGGTWAEWQELVDLGHGIASHGLHAYDESTQGINVTNEYRNSQSALTGNLTGVDALTLAYPNGLKPPNDKVLAAEYYIAARGVVGGVNTGASIDYMDPKSVSMNATTAVGITDPGTWYYYGHAINPAHHYYAGWQSVHFHNVSASMVPGVTQLAAALSDNEADIWTGRFQDVVKYGLERENATLTVESVTGSEIRFTVSDTLDDTRFDFPLTIKVRIDSAWDNIVALQNGTEVPILRVEHDGNSYALVQAVPDGGQVTLRQGNSEGLLVVVRSPSKNRVWVDGGFSGMASGAYDAPYPTIQEGLNAAAPGEIVTIREGMYREHVILQSGMINQPITLAAAPGERVILNAMVPLLNWQPMAGGLFSAPVSWAPGALYFGSQKRPNAREPNEGWWKAEDVGAADSDATFILTDEAHLRDLPCDLMGATVYIWTQADDCFYTCPVISFDPVLGRIEFENVNPVMSPAAGDLYWLQNQISLIDRPGEWVSRPEGDGFRIVYRPVAAADLAEMQLPPASGRPVSGQDVAHVRLRGLEVIGGADHGIYLLGAQDVEVSQCIVHDNMLYGLWMRRATDCSVQHNIFMDNRYGLVCEESTNVCVEANEIGPNSEVGLVFAHNASDICIQNNYIHDHMLWGHQDNVQLLQSVSGVHLVNNLIMAGGQSVMMEATTDGEFRGNMVIGSVSNMVAFDRGSARDFVLRGNTLALSGYRCLAMTGQQYEVKENIFTSGHNASMYTVSDTINYLGDRNLFWNGARLVEPTILVSDGDWGGGPPELFSVVYKCNALAAGASAIDGMSSHVDVAVGSLTLPGTFPASNWPDALTALQNNAGINSLSAAIDGGDYFTFTVTPDVQTTASYTQLHVRVSLGANVQPATTVFTFMSSLTGFSVSDALVAFTNETFAASTMGILNDLDLGGIPSLQDVAPGTEVEFRLYAHNIGINPMTRIGIGKAWGASADDLRLSGTVSSGSGAGGSPEKIYHTHLSTFQSTTGQDLGSVSGNPLFLNAPFGIHVMDRTRLDEASRDTFALRDLNTFLVGDMVEVNFDGVVRMVTASEGLMLSIDPPLRAAPLREGLVANWGGRDDFALDLGLQAGSPAVVLREDGGAVGSSVSVSDFKKGDFNGDGRRDLPEYPADLIK